MKLTRLRLSEIRQFRGSLVIPSFGPALNVFCGPNEAGKSTIVRAIRAAFFERYRSTVVDDLIARGETPTSASPTIEVSFDIDGMGYTLTKTFFVKKRCTLTGGPKPLDGDEAEEAVSRLLSYSYAGKGLSKPEHWGIPGLLWIEQGESHQVVEAVGHAADHLRTALESTVGAVASSSGDEVLGAIREQRDRLLTQTSRPRGEYEQVTADLAAISTRLAQLDARIAQYKGDVDRLTALKGKHEIEERQKPWEGFRGQLAAAEAALSEAVQVQGRLQAAEDEAKRLEQTRQILEQRVRDFVGLRTDFGTREREARIALEECAEAENAVSTFERRLSETRGAMEASAAAVAVAEREQLRRDVEVTLFNAKEEQQRVANALRDSEGDEARMHSLQAIALENTLAEKDLALLQSLVANSQQLEATSQAAATGMTFELNEGVELTLNGAPIPAKSEHRITSKAIVEIPGVGSITVRPGANDADQIAIELSDVRLEIAKVTARLGVASLDEARARSSRAEQARTEAEGVKRLLNVRAPKGLEQLRAEAAQAAARASAAADRLQSLPPVLPEGHATTVEDSRQTHELAKVAWHEATDRLSLAAQRLAGSKVRLDGARTEVERLRGIVNDAQTGINESAATVALADTNVKLDAAKASIAELRGKLQSTKPEILKQDVARFRSSAEGALNAFNARTAEIHGLLGRLEAEGANGLEEEREELRVTEQIAVRRLQELKLRAEALDLLVGRMEGKREALTRKLQAPLQTRMDHYIGILFPQAQMGLLDDLTPGALTRGIHTVDFIQLSYGAQEQTALISRLAYADLLKEAGTPTLIMLDDALVHSDAARLEQMKRVIYDGASRHQILLFTCHPERWEGVGVTAREVRSFVQ